MQPHAHANEPLIIAASVRDRSHDSAQVIQAVIGCRAVMHEPGAFWTVQQFHERGGSLRRVARLAKDGLVSLPAGVFAAHAYHIAG